MIIKKKLNQFPVINIITKLLNRLVQILGSITLIVFFLLIFHYFNSGLYERYKPITVLKKIDELIIDKYLGFSFFEIDDYLSNNFRSLKYIILKNELEDVTLNINQKNLYNLELQRKNKLNGLSENIEKFSLGSLNYNQKNFNIKLRVKGDRVLHFYDKIKHLIE